MKCTTHHAPRTTHHAPRTTHHAPRTKWVSAATAVLGLCSISYGQVDVGPACPTDGGLRSVTNIFSPDIVDIYSDGLKRVYPIGDLNHDGLVDMLAVDYYESSHFAVVANGDTGSILYALEAASPQGYYFAVDANGMPDVNLDGVDDFILVSHDVTLGSVDVMIISGMDGSGVAKLLKVPNDGNIDQYQAIPFADSDKSGTTDGVDTSYVLASSSGGYPVPGCDLNLDGVVDENDLAIVQAQSGSISSTLVSRIANALGATIDGDLITVTDQEGGLLNWLRALWNCQTCLIDCADAYTAAWECRQQLKQAECDCWELDDLFDVAACLDDLRLNFMRDCIDDVAAAAGSCGQCIYECHPLAVRS